MSDEEHIKDKLSRLQGARHSARGAVEELKDVGQYTMYKEDEIAETANNLQKKADELALKISKKIEQVEEEIENE